jgi:hypothetical protein
MEDRLIKYAERLGKTKEQLKEELHQLYEQEKKLHPTMADDMIKVRCLKLLFIRYRKELSSPAKWYEGVIIGDTGITNVVEGIRAKALEMFRREPDKAIQLNIVNAQGQVLDTREFIGGAKNPNYLKPLPEHLYIRNIFGIARDVSAKGDWFAFRMLLGERNNNYKKEVPLYTPIKFRANEGKKFVEGINGLNCSTATNFEKIQLDINLPELIKKVYNPFYIDLTKLEQWHISKLDISRVKRIILTEGIVVDIREINPERSLVLLNDGTMENDIPVFVKSSDVTFDAESEVIVFGTTATGRKLIKETGERVAGGVSINAYGIIPTVIITEEKAGEAVVTEEEKEKEEEEKEEEEKEELW